MSAEQLAEMKGSYSVDDGPAGEFDNLLDAINACKAAAKANRTFSHVFEHHGGRQSEVWEVDGRSARAITRPSRTRKVSGGLRGCARVRPAVTARAPAMSDRATVKSATPSANDLLAMPDRDGDPIIIREADLTSWAAFEAARVLAQNWSAALAAGEPLTELVGDLDTVIDLLTRWKAAVSKHYGGAA